MDYLFQYLLFLAQAITVVVAIVILLGFMASLGQRNAEPKSGRLQLRKLNTHLEDLKSAMEEVLLEEGELKKLRKSQQKEEKQKAKGKSETESRNRLFVLDFEGDIEASSVRTLRAEITALLTMATDQDEVLLRLESPGGMVPHYGLAASQLHRIRSAGVPLVVAVDKVAASGGYLMAVVAQRIIAAPFALVGSIGVVAELPNLHKVLKKNDVDYDVYTAGEYKRTVTVLGENTEQGVAKFREELEDTHQLFKEYVAEHREVVDLSEVATGEVWYGARAVAHRLVDELCTSDEYIVKACDERDVFELKWSEPKKPLERLLGDAAGRMTRWVKARAPFSSRGVGRVRMEMSDS